MPEQTWYYAKNGERLGPFSFGQIRQMAAAGMIGPEDSLMRGGDVGWVRADTVPSLFEPIGGMPPTASEETPATPAARARRPGLVEIARWHRWLLWTAVPYLLLVVLDVLAVFSGSVRAFQQTVKPLALLVAISILVTWPPLCFFLARALGRSPWLYAVLAAIPLINIGVLVDLSGRAARVLRAAGVKVGILGGQVDADVFEAAVAEPAPRSESPDPDLSAQGGSVVPKWVLVGCAVPAGVLVLLGCGLGALAYLVRDVDQSPPTAPRDPIPAPAPVTVPVTESGIVTPVRREQSFGSGQVVYWSDDSLTEDAVKLGKALRETGYFNGKGEKGVELARAGDTHVVKVYMLSSEIDKPRVQAMMRDYAGVLWGALAFEGKPLVVKLCDETKAERTSYSIEPSSRYQFGPGCYVYHTSVLRAEAERFGRFAAKTGGTDRPSNWTLTQQGRNWTVCPGATGDVVTPEAREGFRQAAQQISDEVFSGEPVELRVFTRQGIETASAGR